MILEKNQENFDKIFKTLTEKSSVVPDHVKAVATSFNNLRVEFEESLKKKEELERDYAKNQEILVGLNKSLDEVLTILFNLVNALPEEQFKIFE